MKPLCTVWAGCGGAVIALSDADDEWREVLLKARTAMRAVAATVTGDAAAFEVAQ